MITILALLLGCSSPDATGEAAAARSAANTAPVASTSGSDTTATLGSAFTLDASASSDPEGDALTYRWKVLKVPSASGLWSNHIANRDAATTSFTPDVAGTCRFSVRVDDGSLTDEETLGTTVVSGSNTAPVASTAGSDTTATLGDALVLDSSASTDADGDSLTSRWKLLSVPSGSGLWSNDIADRDATTTSFTPDVAGSYTFSVRVDDGTDADTDTTTFTAVVSGSANTAPVASTSGTDTSAVLGDVLTLDASASTDADGDSLTWRWKVISVPSGSALWSNDIADRNAATTTFTPDVDGEDGDCASDASCVEDTLATCTDGSDNDGDGDVDCDDSDCWGISCNVVATRITGGNMTIKQQRTERNTVSYGIGLHGYQDRRTFDIDSVQGVAHVMRTSGSSSCTFTIGNVHQTRSFNKIISTTSVRSNDHFASRVAVATSGGSSQAYSGGALTQMTSSQWLPRWIFESPDNGLPQLEGGSGRTGFVPRYIGTGTSTLSSTSFVPSAIYRGGYQVSSFHEENTWYANAQSVGTESFVFKWR